MSKQEYCRNNTKQKPRITVLDGICRKSVSSQLAGCGLQLISVGPQNAYTRASLVGSMIEEDRQAINDLTRMAFLYMQRGELDKAAELMALAEQIERRLARNPHASSKERRQRSN